MTDNAKPLNQYKLDDKFVRSIRLNYVAMTIAIWAFLYFLGALTDNLGHINAREISPALIPWINFLTVALLCLITVIIVFFNAGSKYKGYIVMMDDKVIGRTNYKNENKVMEFSQISYTIKTYKGSLFIYDSNQTVLVIPYAVDGYDDLSKIITERSPVVIDGPYSIYQKHSFLAIFLFFALFATMLALTNKIVVGITGLLLIIGVILVFKPGYDRVRSYNKVQANRLIIISVIYFFGISFFLAQKLMEK